MLIRYCHRQSFTYSFIRISFVLIFFCVALTVDNTCCILSAFHEIYMGLCAIVSREPLNKVTKGFGKGIRH